LRRSNYNNTWHNIQVDDDSRIDLLFSSYFFSYFAFDTRSIFLLLNFLVDDRSTGLADWALYRPQVIWCIINIFLRVCVCS
jgi:hypothetical protein